MSTTSPSLAICTSIPAHIVSLSFFSMAFIEWYSKSWLMPVRRARFGCRERIHSRLCGIWQQCDEKNVFFPFTLPRPPPPPFLYLRKVEVRGMCSCFEEAVDNEQVDGGSPQNGLGVRRYARHVRDVSYALLLAENKRRAFVILPKKEYFLYLIFMFILHVKYNIYI